MRIFKLCRHNADYPIRDPVQTQCASQNIRASTQRRLPKSITYYGNPLIPRLFII